MRAEVFVQVLKYCIRAGRLNALHAVVLENVKGILQRTNKGSSPTFMDSVLQEVRKALPDFDWQVAVLKAQDYKLGQQRTRVFLRGLRRVFGEVPDPLDAQSLKIGPLTSTCSGPTAFPLGLSQHLRPLLRHGRPWHMFT